MVTSGEIGPAAELVKLPEGATPDHGITIISYLDAGGGLAFGLQIHGDAPISMTVGLLQMSTHHLMHWANPYDGSDADDDEPDQNGDS